MPAKSVLETSDRGRAEPPREPIGTRAYLRSSPSLSRMPWRLESRALPIRLLSEPRSLRIGVVTRGSPQPQRRWRTRRTLTSGALEEPRGGGRLREPAGCRHHEINESGGEHDGAEAG